MKKIHLLLFILIPLSLYPARPPKYPNGAYFGQINNKNTMVMDLISPYEEAF